tara:strand:+ start:319 stop:552 length:234 start_codon:yes stop_codon:yes gene_type:complete
VDDSAQGLFTRRVAPDQFLFWDFWNEMALHEGLGSALPKESDLPSSASVDLVDNFGEALFLSVPSSWLRLARPLIGS